MSHVDTLAYLIAATIGTWEHPFVEQSIFGTADPALIAASVNTFCATELGAPIDEGLFYESSQGVVFGLRLQDRRQVVLKGHPPKQPLTFLQAVHEVQSHLAAQGYPCPRPILGPRSLGHGHAVVEELIDSGVYADAHDPAIRRMMAEHLAELVRRTRDLTTLPGLQPGLLSRRDTGRLWPTPHSVIFDFEATATDSEWIDELARRAKETLIRSSGELVIGHTDWSVKHFRFAQGRVSVIYDWDSIALEQEAVIVGDAARGFTMTWHLDVPLAPGAEEARAFVAEYEAARGKAFTAAERVTMSAAATYAMAYSARCEHCLNPLADAASFPIGSYRAALARYGEHLL